MRSLMGNMPHVTPVEIAVLGGAVVLLYIVPALFTLGAAWRRRRLARATAARAALELAAAQWEATAPSVESEGAPALGAPAEGAPESPGDWESEIPVVGDAVTPPVAVEAATSHSGAPDAAALPETAESGAPVPAPDAAPEAPSFVPPVASALAPAVAAASLRGAGPLEIHANDTSSAYRFRLEDLRQARLADLPPVAVRNDPELARSWREAEQAADQHWRAIASATIVSPYPARATTLAAAEIIGSTIRLRYLLFPLVWPIAVHQAVAEAVFELIPERDEIRGWVDALSAAELTDDHRRDIQSSGAAQ
jgi:hypothetical protein